MKKPLKIILFLSPLISVIELLLYTYITELLSYQNDVAVIMGVVLLCIAIAGNYYLTKFIIKQIKTN